MKTPKHRILAILKDFDHDNQVKILESCQKSLKLIDKRKQSLIEWSNIEPNKSNQV